MFLLDTNVVSELQEGDARARRTLRVAAWADGVDARIEPVPAGDGTIQELEIGVLLAERRDPGAGRACCGPGSTKPGAAGFGRPHPGQSTRPSPGGARACTCPIPAPCGTG